MGKIEDYILNRLEEKKKLLFLVLDPLDHPSLEHLVETAKNGESADVDALLVGGSTGVQGEFLDRVIKEVKSETNLPVILFPGNIGTVSRYADALYFMSMLNSRNPYWISRAQMLAAPLVKKYDIEPLPTAYAVVSPGGTVGWVGEADLLPRDKPKLAAALALAAQYMGFRFFITDAGSASQGHVPLDIVSTVSKTIDIPYIVAGGIKTPEEAKAITKAGADIIQLGTVFEKDNSVENFKRFIKAIR